ncbi:MAG: hypothetical protein QNJ78_14135, partial [Gammaproteobacteria bacterium]|nr:hypothetical protein [Gammaproteobacteria bacterium]
MYKAKALLSLMICILCLSPVGSVFGKDRLTMGTEVPFDKMVRVPNNVRMECDLTNKLANYIQGQLEQNDVEVLTVDDVAKAKGKVLDMKIVDVRGF